ncbi:MAG: hypothetical protein ABEI52_09475, partial [Halobacteriaceae archaeon]
MNATEATLRHRLQEYLDHVAFDDVDTILGACLTGSIAAGFVDEHSDIDLTIVMRGDGGDIDADAFSALIIPESATVHRSEPLERYSFDWSDGHLDVDVVSLDDLRADAWDLTTRWEYANAEILVDTDQRLAARLEREVPFAKGERATIVRDHADEFLFAAQWDVHKACL